MEKRYDRVFIPFKQRQQQHAAKMKIIEEKKTKNVLCEPIENAMEQTNENHPTIKHVINSNSHILVNFQMKIGNV